MARPRVRDSRGPPDARGCPSPSWLTQALGGRFPGIVVSKAIPGPVVSRVSTNVRFGIECEGGWPEGLPAELCVKGYFAEPSSRQAGEPEAFFYRDLAEKVGVRTLQSFYADVDPATRHGVIITGDVVARGATFLDALTPYSPEQARMSLEQYAVLHGRTWQGPGLRDIGWLAPELPALSGAWPARNPGQF